MKWPEDHTELHECCWEIYWIHIELGWRFFSTQWSLSLFVLDFNTFYRKNRNFSSLQCFSEHLSFNIFYFFIILHLHSELLAFKSVIYKIFDPFSNLPTKFIMMKAILCENNIFPKIFRHTRKIIYNLHKQFRFARMQRQLCVPFYDYEVAKELPFVWSWNISNRMCKFSRPCSDNNCAFTQKRKREKQIFMKKDHKFIC